MQTQQPNTIWAVSGHPLLSDLPTNKPASILTEKEELLISQVFLLIAMAVAAFGAFANCVNITTFVSIGVEDGVTTVFLAIAISDLTFVTLVLVRNVAYLLYTLETAASAWWFPIDPMAVFLFSGIVGKIAFTTTALSSTFMAVARCMCVVKPLHFRNMFTKDRCLVAILFCTIIPIACQIPNLANMGIKPRFDLTQNSTRPALWFSPDRNRISDIFRIIMDTILLIVTEVVVVFCIMIMTSALRKATAFRNQQQADSTTNKGTSSSKLTGKDLQVVKQVVIISTIYILCNIPKICHCIIDVTDSRFDFGQPFYSLYITLIHVNTVFTTLNSTLNFFVYLYFNSKFRSMCFLTRDKAESKLSNKSGYEED